MPLSFAGVPLGFPDAEGRIQDLFDKWLPLSDSRMIVEWPTPHGNAGVGPYYPGQPLPAPNWSKPPRPKLNTWYRPTGASRWGFGFFLADYQNLKTMLSAVGSGNSPQTLTMESPAGYSRSWQTYMLPPHPVSAQGDTANGLWIVPLVDQRYYWQFTSLGNAGIYGTLLDNTAPTAKSWAALLGQAIAGNGISAVDSVASSYLQPNLFFLKAAATEISYGQYVDALAFSVGHRVIPDGANSWKTANWSTSLSRRQSNLAAVDAGTLQAGTFSPYPAAPAIVPNQIEVVFRIWKNGITLGDWSSQQRYISDVTAAAAGASGTPTASLVNTVVIHSTALANISTSGDATSPDNKAALDALATQIATDYYSSLWIQDSIRPGISGWQESGFDDYVEFTMTNRPEFGLIGKTRIHSAPYNQQMGVMLHYDPSTWEYGERIYGTLDNNLAANGTQTITLLGTDGAKPSGTNHIKVNEVLGAPILKGTKIQALRYGDKWAALSAGSGSGGGSVGVGSCVNLVTAGNSDTFTLTIPTGTATVPVTVPYGVTQANTPYLVALGSDGTYYVLNPDKIVFGQFSTAVAAGAAGAFGTFTIFSGALGSEVSTGVAVTAFVREGVCVTGITYTAAIGSFGYQIIDPDIVFQGQCATLTDCTAGATVTMTIYGGTAGSESSQSITVSVYVRKGIIFTGQTYKVTQTNDGYEVTDPSLAFRGQPGATIATDAAGSMVIYTGTGAGAASGTTVSGIRNDTSCSVILNKLAYAKWMDSLNGWAFDIFHNA